MNNQLNVLFIDLELTHAIYYAYPSKREQYLSASNIIQDQFCICASWTWNNDKDVNVIKISDDKKRFKSNFRNDYVVAKKIHELMEEADIIVAHNGDKFDIKHSNALFIKHGLTPVPKTKTIDTLKVAKKYFAFPGNSLDQLSKRFGSTGKNQKPDWFKLAEGNLDAINTAAVYCKNDVKELRFIFEKMRPFIESFPGPRRFIDEIKYCDACNSKRLENWGLKQFGGQPYYRVKCLECGAENRSKKPFIKEEKNPKLIMHPKKCHCGCKHLVNKGKSFDGHQAFFQVKCMDCGDILHCGEKYEKAT